MAEGLEPGDVVTVDFEYDPDDSEPDNNLLTKSQRIFIKLELLRRACFLVVQTAFRLIGRQSTKKLEKPYFPGE